MKFRMLMLVIAVLVFASLSFGQSASMFFYWTNMTIAGNDNWYPLLYDCNQPVSTENDTLHDGVVVRVFGTYDLASRNYLNDFPLTVGHDGSAGEIWPTNELEFNSQMLLSYGATEGSFTNLDQLAFEGGIPPSVPPFYLVLHIGYWDESHTTWTTAYYSHRMNIAGGYLEYSIGDNHNPWNDPIWTCVDTIPNPFTCEQDTVILPWEPWGSFCIELCAEGSGALEIYVGPFPMTCYDLYSEEVVAPVLMPGCDPFVSDCNNPGCSPAVFSTYGPEMSWSLLNGEPYFKTTTPIEVTQSGCACIFYDGPLTTYSAYCWLPVELMSFTAEPTVNGIQVEFRTGSETDNDYFELLRSDNGTEYDVLSRLNTQGNGASGHTYNYLDRHVTAGQTYSYKLADIDINGERTVHDNIVTATAVGGNLIPEGYDLYVYPNPFNPTTTISFSVIESMPVQLAVYDVTGRQVAELINSTIEPGRHDITFDATGLPSGLYLTKLTAAENTFVQKMVLMK